MHGFFDMQSLLNTEPKNPSESQFPIIAVHSCNPQRQDENQEATAGCRASPPGIRSFSLPLTLMPLHNDEFFTHRGPLRAGEQESDTADATIADLGRLVAAVTHKPVPHLQQITFLQPMVGCVGLLSPFTIILPHLSCRPTT